MAGRHDQAARRRGVRKQRERGLSLYIPAEQLDECGIGRHVPVVYYRTWPTRSGRGTILVQLYTEP